MYYPIPEVSYQTPESPLLMLYLVILPKVKQKLMQNSPNRRLDLFN